jgi:prepilin-type N-terminal cleavage/methylation domain-containing protein
MLVRRQDGFTLPELLVAMSIGLILSLATFSLVEFVMKSRPGWTRPSAPAWRWT